MELIILVGVAIAVVVLFVSNSRMRGELDKLIEENRIQTANLTRLEGLYGAILAARHADIPSAPVPPTPLTPVTPASPKPADAPAPPEAVQPVTKMGDTPQPVPPVPPVPPVSEVPPTVEDEPELAAAAMATPAKPAPRRFEWERFVGVNLPIWIGAVALCVAGYFFVSYAIESGFFTPEFRVLAGVLAGLAFLAGAETVRRRMRRGNAANIAAALATAGIATLYATAYIASVTYAVVPQAMGFAAMVGVTALAVVIAFVFGQAVALVGLVGGYLTPALYPSDTPSAITLFGYLIALHLAMFAVLRLRGWWHLTLLALAGPAVWIMLWSLLPGFESQPWPAIVFLLLIPVIAGAASGNTWLGDGEPLSLAGGTKGWSRRALPLAMVAAAFGFVVFLHESGYDLAFWQGFVAFAVFSVVAAFARPVSLSYLQLTALAAAAFALLAHPLASFAEVAPFVLVFALIHGFGALDQFRRMRRPDIWAGAIAAITLFFFGVALFKITGWQSALEQKHLWALAALALAAGLTALLWFYGPRVADERERSRVYAALGAGVTSLISLAIVLELDPSLFPAASALGVLGLAAIHTRVPVRGLRVLAAVYAAVYALLVVGAAARVVTPGIGLHYLLARSLGENPFVLLILPGAALFLASTLFRRNPPATGREILAEVLDVGAGLALVMGILYAARPEFWALRDVDAYIFAAQVTGPLAIVAALAAYVGQRFARTALYYGGLVLALLLGLGMMAEVVGPIYRFWPGFALPAWGILDVSWLALGLPAVAYILMGRHLRITGVDRYVVNYGRGLTAFGVITLYTLLLVEIRRAYQGGGLLGAMGSAENYTYSAATLAFGLLLLLIGVVIQNPLPRALSLVFVLAATVKVFLFDAASLEGLWRVLSFLGMGLSFLGISWAYARYVFGIGRRPPKPATAPPTPPPEPETA